MTGGPRRPPRRWTRRAVLRALSAGALGSAAAPAVWTQERVRSEDREVLERAAEGARRLRRSRVHLKLLDRSGAPIGKRKVRLETVRGAFPFGCIFRPRHYRNDTYFERFLKLFNFVELLEFNWGQYEPDEGKPLREERRKFIFERAIPAGLDRFYGHMLVWSPQYGKYPKTNLPLWLFKYDAKTQYRLCLERVRREVRDYRDAAILWDVVNEPVHVRRWGDWEKPGWMLEPLERVVPYVLDALRAAHEANPEARLLINEYAVIPRGAHRDRFMRLIDALRKADAPLHAIGIQGHEPHKGAYWYRPAELWDACEVFGREFGLPIYFTEVFFVSDPSRKIEGRRAAGRWSPENQARAIEEFYRTAFGHPSVAGIVYFGLSDGDVVRPSIGLLDAEWKPKPAWRRLERLLRGEWRTSGTFETAADGSLAFEGFHGTYRLESGEGRDRMRWRLELGPGAKPEVTLQAVEEEG